MESEDFNKGIETTMDVQWDNLRTYRKHHECGMCGKADHVRQCSTGGCYVHTKDRGTKIDSPDAEQYLYPLDRYLGANPGLTQPEEWQPEAPPPSPSDDSDFFERAQSLVREAETQLDCFRKIYNIDSESDQQQPKVTQSVPCPTESSGQVSHPNRIRNIVVALDALQAESSRLEDDVLRARAFAKDISDEIGSDCKPSKSSRTCQRRLCEHKTRKLVSERSRDPQERVKERATIPSPRKQAEYPRSETTSASTYDAEQKKLSPPSRRRSQRLTWHTNLLRAKSSTEGTDDGYNTSDGRRYRETSAEKKCKCAINKKKCLCLSYHRKVPEKPIVESSCACGSRKCSCSSKEVKSSPKWQLSRHHSNVNMCPCCEQQERDCVTTVVKKKYTPGCCKATLIDVKTQQWSTEEEEVNRKKLPLAKLTIQELPSINIRRELKIQRVPSYDLPKPPGEEIPYTPRENVGLIDITHDDTIRERQSQWRKGDNIRRVRRSSYIGENISDSEVHHAHRVEKEVEVVRPANHSSKPGPSKPCAHKASKSIPCQCSLRSHKSVHFSGVEERTFMFDLNHGRSFSLERHSSETEYSGLDPSELCEMMGLRDSNFARRPFDDTDYDSETGSICARCRSLSCSSHRRAAGTKPVPKVSSQEQPREKQEPKDARPVPKSKKQIPILQEREQELDPVRPCRKSDNLPCKSRKTLEEVRTADVSSTVQQREDSIQTGVPLVGDRQEETVLKSAVMPCKPQQSSTGLQKRDQASAQPQLSPPKAKKSKCLVQSRITQTSYSPQDTQEGPSTSRQWEHSSGVETHSLPSKCRKNLEQARPTGMSVVPEERPATLHHLEQSLGGDRTGTEAPSLPCKCRKNLEQARPTGMSVVPEERPATLHHMERSLGGQQAGTEARSPPCKFRKNLELARPTGMSIVPEQRPATLHHMERSLGGDRTGTEARSLPCKHRRNLVQTVTTQMSYIPQEEPSASHQWEQSPGAEPQLLPHKHTKTSDHKQEPTTTAVPKTKIARQERKTFPFPDSSYIPIVAMAPFPPPARDKRTKRSESRKTVPRSEKSQDRQRTAKMDQNSVFPDVSCIPMVIQSPKGIQSLYDTDYPDEAAVDRMNARLVSSTSPHREVCSNRSPSDTPTITVYSSKDPASKRQEMRATPADDEAREMKPKAPADRCSCAEPGGKCSCVSQREEGNVKVDKGEVKHSEYVKFDVEGKPNLNSVKKSKRAHIQGIFEPLDELPCEDLWKISSNKEIDAVVQGERNTSTGFVPQDDLSPNNAVPQSLRLGSGITVTDFLSAGSVMRRLFTSQKTEDASTLCVSGVPYLAPGSLHRSKMRLSHTSHPRSENEEAQLRTTSGKASADRPGRSHGGTTLVSPATPESPEGERASNDVTSTATIKHLQQAIMSRVENAIMRGLLDESETSDSPSDVTSTQQDIASPEVEEAAALPAEYEEDFESEEEGAGAGAEDEPVSEDLVGSEATAESVAEASQESSLPTSQEAAVVKRSESSQTSSEAAAIKRSESPQTSSEAAVIKRSESSQTSSEAAVVKRSESPQTSSEAAVIKRSESSQTSSEAAAIKRSESPQTSSEAAVIKRSESSQTSSEAAAIKRSESPQTSSEAAVIKRSESSQTSSEAAVQTSFIKRSEPPQTSPEAAAQTSFIKHSEPPQTSPEAAAQTSFIQPSSSSVDSPEVASPMSPSRSSSSTVKIYPQPSEPAPPSSSSKKLPGPSGQTSQRQSSVCPVLKPSLCTALPPALKKPSVDSPLVSSPKKSTAETPTELSPPRTPALSPKKASPLRSPVKTPPLSPEPGSFSPVPSAKMTPLLSPESFSSDTEERVICVTTPPITPPRSPSSSLADVETPSPTENQQPNIESWQDNAPVQRVPEPRQRRVEEILIPVESERTDVSCTILSDSVATDRTSETAVSVDEEEPVLSEGEIRPDPCPCKKCRRSCVCPSVSKGEIRQPCRCACSEGEARSQMDDSIGEVRHHKRTCRRHHSHRSSTYSDGQVLPCRVPRRHEEMYSMGEVAHDDTYSAGQIQSPHIEVYLSPSLTGDSSDSELCGSASLCEELFDQEIHLPSVSNGSDEQSQTILSLGQLSEDDSGL